MRNTRLRPFLLFAFFCAAVRVSMPMDPAVAAEAKLQIHCNQRSAHPIPELINGKFTEHLFNNVYHGIDSQILRNPTLAALPFWTGQTTPDGVATFQWESEKIESQIRREASRLGWPELDVAGLTQAYTDGLACWWTRVGSRDEVVVSPDTAPYGQRAQRVELRKPGTGIAQWTWLPLHRVRTYEFSVYLRSPDVRRVSVSLNGSDSAAATEIKVSEEWREYKGKLTLPADAPPVGAYRLAITASAPGQIILGHVFLRPADHVEGVDPDVLKFLRDGRIPIHRWPGGNFVSGYHWRNGVGPIERRPTVPNPAWGQPEPNTFGTDEFLALCRAMGSQPMICVNAGDGTPEEAAQWVEYCNGSTRTRMGKLRAANGHPAPYRVPHWEVGNELWGRWQVHWTTGPGYADRFEQFTKAMLKADPSITLYACGAPVHWGKAWNDALISRAAGILRRTTDHPLIGGDVSLNADPLDVFRDFMAVPEMLEKKWAALDGQMRAAGIREPRLAITELQMFAHLARATDANAPVRLAATNLVNPGTVAEALYDVLFYHAAVRLAPFVEFVTHSATVNHGGGLRKEHERVYANPCYYAQATFHELAGSTPVAITLDAPTEKSPLVLPDLRNNPPQSPIKTVDALVALTADGDLLLSIVHRAGAAATHLAVEIEQFQAANSAEVRTIAGEKPWDANTLAEPNRIHPVDSTVIVQSGDMARLELELPPYSVLRVRVPKSALGPSGRSRRIDGRNGK